MNEVQKLAAALEAARADWEQSPLNADALYSGSHAE